MTKAKRNVVSRFRGEYSFLSNFYESLMIYDFYSLPFYKEKGDKLLIQVNTNEHFFQACKAWNFFGHYNIMARRSPKEAKKAGRKVDLRPDWDAIKIDVMRYGLRLKFNQNQRLKKKLIDTYPMILEEGNTWNDTIWGVDIYTGYGMNLLGKLLMELRDDYMGGISYIEDYIDDIIDDL